MTASTKQDVWDQILALLFGLAGNPTARRAIRFWFWSLVVLYAFFLLQVVAILLGGSSTFEAMFVLHRPPWNVLTWVTHTLAHKDPQHLRDNLVTMWLYAPAVVHLLNVRQVALAGILGGAVTGLLQLLAGTDGLIGASGGANVIRGLAWGTILAWMPVALKFIAAKFRQIRLAFRVPGKQIGAIYHFAPILFVGTGIIMMPIDTGINLAVNVHGLTQFMSYDWGTAPRGSAYVAHLAGMAIGFVGGIALHATRRRHGASSGARAK